MADPGRLTPADYDVWRLATPLQFLQLMHRLGRSGREMARALGVKEAAISQWSRAKRPIPPRYAAPLRNAARLAWDEAAELTDKAAALAPSEDVRQAIRAEFGALYQRWKSEVLYDAGTLHRGLEQQTAALAALVRKPRFTAEDRETAALMTESILAKMDMLRMLDPEAPSPEDELIARLTEAHTAAAPVVLTAEERAAAEAALSDVLAPDDQDVVPPAD
jgi:DNA-binding transcriptional regulator YdaS (Cro superfamily)